MRIHNVFFWLAAATVIGSFTPAAAQDLSGIPEGFETGFHIVRPGESLRRITRNYLGSEELWERNWRLNPEIENPDRLRPGDRMQVLLRPEAAVPSAQVVSISGTVQERPDPITWTAARRHDLIVESDGIQTGGESSTALRFSDGSSLVLTEDSIVFLKVAGRTLRGIETRSVEIVEGQADLAGGSMSERPAEIEFVIGDTKTRPKPGPSGSSEARLRKSDSGSAQLMVYEGASEVEAGGKKVAVEQGMGTSVPEGAAPLPPEKLLPKPALTSPAPGGNLELGQLEFSWEAVEGAVRYVVEVCSDAGCEALVTRAVDVPSTTWEAEELPLGDLRWRVTAVSPSGLDGYPAPTRPFSVALERAEFDPPTARFSLPALSVERTLDGESRVFYASTARVLVEVEDPSGVAFWQPLIDGELSEKSALAGGWSDGVHTVTVRAEDELGNRGEGGQSVSFEVDAEAPELTWKVGDEEILEELFGKESLELPESRWWLKRGWRRNARRVRNHRTPEWTLVAWGNEKIDSRDTLERRSMISGLYLPYRGLRVTGEAPEVVILAPGILDRRNDGAPGAGKFLVVQAADRGAGVEELSVTSLGSAAAGYQLRARCRDRLGNVVTAKWDFGPSAP